MYQKALQHAPTDSKQLFVLHYAQLLFTMGQNEKVTSLLEAELLKGQSKPSVYFLLGKAYGKLGDIRKAVMNMTMAQDFNAHKTSTTIKDAIGFL